MATESVDILQDTEVGSMLMNYITEVKEDLDNLTVTFEIE